MKVFITGGTGFIGTQTVKRLTRLGHQLYCLVRRTSPVLELERLGVTLIPGDVTDRNSLQRGMKGCNGVINLAAAYSFWTPDKSIFRTVNVQGTLNVMECALEAGVAKVIHVSSAGVWGTTPDSPFTEQSPVGSIRFGDYFQTKYEGDLIAWELHATKGLPLVVIYPGTVLGPGDPKATGQYLSNLLRRRLPVSVFNGTVLPFVYVGDVAEAIASALEKKDNVGERYLVGKYHLSMKEFNALVNEVSGVPLPRMSLPNSCAVLGAALLTRLADLMKKPPILGLSSDLVSLLRVGGVFDGSKGERELNLTYTPIRVALTEAIRAMQR